MAFRGKLIASGADAKTIKGNGDKYETAIMYMQPWKSSGINVCANAEIAGCIDGCLFTAGRGAMNTVQAARAKKTAWFAADRDGFMAQLVVDVTKFVKYCDKQGVMPVIRLNGTSDIRWERIAVDDYANIFDMFPTVQWYDYTKIANRKIENVSNYHLTFSYSEANPLYKKQIEIAKAKGMNMAVVFRSVDAIPHHFMDRPVISGDADDLRFLDPDGVVVSLYAKGRAKKDTSGFVIDTERKAV
tara:strand:- start:329 stop:1060 length:732 start_codon:yes stop_codon:yes gene_type:complete